LWNVRFRTSVRLVFPTGGDRRRLCHRHRDPSYRWLVQARL